MSDFNESCWVRLKLKGTDSLLIGNIYRSPSSTKENNLKLLELLRLTSQEKDSHMLVVGDFNYGSVNWELLQSSEGINSCSSTFVECIKDLFLYQHVESDTRFREGQAPSRLDLVFTNEKEMVSDLEGLPPIGASDHSCLQFKFQCYTNQNDCGTPRPAFHKGDYPSLRAFFNSENWEGHTNINVEDSWKMLCTKVNEGIDRFIPKTTPGKHKKKHKWIDKNAMTAIKDKKKAWKKYSMCKNDQNYQKYSEQRNKATSACRSAKYQFEKRLASNISNDSNPFGAMYVPNQELNQP